MVLDYNVKSKIKLNIFEDYDCGDVYHRKYNSNARVFWDILKAEILEDTVKLKVVRSQEDERATETYIDADDYDKYSYYALKFDMTFWITISKAAIDESLKRHDSVKTKILDFSEISTELIEAKYSDGVKLSNEEIINILNNYALDSFKYETILVSAEAV